MQKRSLGKCGLVSEIGFGGVEIGMPYGIGVGRNTEPPAEQTSIALLQNALQTGINFFDTAREYGRSEALIGRAFADRRDQIIICSKCKHLPAKLPDKALCRFVVDSCRQSLLALHTAYLDLFLLHDSAITIQNHPAVREALSYLKKNRLVHAVGVSTYTTAETANAIESGFYDVVQVPFNLLDQRQLPYIELAGKRGIGVMVRSALFKGILARKNCELHPALEPVQTHVEALEEWVKEPVRNLAELSVKFILAFPSVSTVLVGIDQFTYLQQAVQMADNRYLGREIVRQLRERAYPDADFLDLRIWDKKGWL
ncbi:aldo/keto reductase [candidate division KSB1 bacterium]|nr:aldo/keto reductase [candidate division KSB1 bacterium]